MNKKYLLFAAAAAIAFFALNKKPDRVEVKIKEPYSEPNSLSGQGLLIDVKVFIDGNLYDDNDIFVQYPKPNITEWDKPPLIVNMIDNIRLEVLAYVDGDSLYSYFDLYKQNVLVDRKKILIYK